ncbi:sensor histidine kinase [Crateriforma conspicua]|uniref:sensor histidine kinase n=1 Tax=Crateriforma conspicua TaxID=2527996 RepID=UPI00118AA267|nr:HAMP domain-containing sensor histidine kinase [Crateriforma conspicua]QDV64897.1 Alkaline phosphatase synthesis sensor protein PhoR [Crateriforma conspicua]
MLERRSLKGPVVLGVVMIVLVIILGAMWVVGNILGATGTPVSPTMFWAMLATGGVLLTFVLAGVITYLTLTVKAFNLNRRQSNFIDSVTHELKSPLASLKLYLQTMTRRAVDADQQQHFHRTMLEDVERLDSLINHLLDAARIERGVEPQPPATVRLDELLDQLAQAACLRYRTDPSVVSIRSNQVTVNSQLIQLEILFRNLIDNAVKYAGDPPEVVVTVSTQNQKDVIVRVADNGCGIPMDQRRKVFGRFVRLGNELERSKPGTGLGLYLVRNVAKTLGGVVRVNDRTGGGTEFEVLLRSVWQHEQARSGDDTESPPTSLLDFPPGEDPMKLPINQFDPKGDGQESIKSDESTVRLAKPGGPSGG